MSENPNWDEPVAVVMRRGDLAAVAQAIGHANNVNDETKRGAGAIRSALEGRDEAAAVGLQRFRYEGGDLNYEPYDSAPGDWSGDLGDLIGDYFRAEDVEALLGSKDELTPCEARELFALWLCHGMQPPEIHPSHPAYTGAQKLGLAGCRCDELGTCGHNPSQRDDGERRSVKL